jgi:periplasmic protein TonB
MTLSLLIATTLHGVVFGGAAIFVSREGLRWPRTISKAPVVEHVDIEVIKARPDPVAAARTAAPVARSPSRARPSAPAPHRSPAVPKPDDAAEVEDSFQLIQADVPVLTASSASMLPPSTSVAAPASAPARRALTRVASRRTAVSAAPRYRSNPVPVYPLPCRRRGEQGSVLLNVVVNADGLPASVSIKQSSGYLLLDRAALEAVRQWSFQPARVGGVPVESRVVVPVRFSLSESR